MKKTSKRKITAYIAFLLMASMLLAGCKDSRNSGHDEKVEVEVDSAATDTIRDNMPVCLLPDNPGIVTIGTKDLVIDASNASEGYLYLSYKGDNSDVKMQMVCNDGITYTYKISIGDTVVPLSQGDGSYNIVVYEGMGNGQYAVMFTDSIDVKLENEFGPYLYPNYYVNFNSDSEAVAIGEKLAEGCTCDLEVIGAVYDYVIENIAYDHEEAQNVASNYVPDIDEILATGKGICFDYASLMTAMLRSQRIPTRLEIGYAGDAYHAWVTTYVQDIGWINGVIQFDGQDWTLMDPTFAANADSKTLEEFVGNGSNYTTKYVY